MSGWRIVVIVGINAEQGNLGPAVDLYRLEESNEGDRFVPIPPLPDGVDVGRVSLYEPMFRRGQILVLDTYGREVCPPWRSPSNWDVEYEECEDLAAAVALSRLTAD